MNDAKPVIVEAVDLDLKSGYRSRIDQKARKLFRMESRLLGLRLTLRRKEWRGAVAEYTAIARLQLPGYDRIVAKRGQSLGAVLSETLEVASRQLRRRARFIRTRLKVERPWA